MRNKNDSTFEIKQLGKIIERHNLLLNIVVTFVVSIIACISAYSGFATLGFDLTGIFLKSPIALYISTSLAIALFRVIWILIPMVEIDENTSTNNDKNDISLLEMLQQAEEHSSWTEIIQIGGTLSDVLWFCSRKALRVQVGQFVSTAAEQKKEYYIWARTEIEDIGNTTFVLGKVKEGINHIKKGIKIAESHFEQTESDKFNFLLSRGYRNLANAYIELNKVTEAKECIKKAEGYSAKINDSIKKQEAMGAIKWSWGKMFSHEHRYLEADKALEDGMKIYDGISSQYKETKMHNDERVVKFYREKGIVLYKYYEQYLETEEAIEKRDEAESALNEGLRSGEALGDYENVFRCCTWLAKIKMHQEAYKTAKSFLKKADKYISFVDVDSVKKDYDMTSLKLNELMKLG